MPDWDSIETNPQLRFTGFIEANTDDFVDDEAEVEDGRVVSRTIKKSTWKVLVRTLPPIDLIEFEVWSKSGGVNVNAGGDRDDGFLVHRVSFLFGGEEVSTASVSRHNGIRASNSYDGFDAMEPATATDFAMAIIDNFDNFKSQSQIEKI